MITVIAGVNGAGKSSVAGSYIRSEGGEYYNPDEYARQWLSENSHRTQAEANAEAWKIGQGLLKAAIAARKPFTLETTLGGRTITGILSEAISHGTPVRLIYCGLASSELHIERVAARVRNGGHDIPEEKIRERWDRSVRNLMHLIEVGADVVVFDNSAPLQHGKPSPKILFSLQEQQLSGLTPDIPDWAKPLAAAALKRTS